MPQLEQSSSGNKHLRQYADCFIAPRTHEVQAKNLLNKCKRYEITTTGIPLENLDQNYTQYHFSTELEGEWDIKIQGLPRKSYRYVNGNVQEMQRLEEELAKKQSLKLPSPLSTNELTHAQGMHFVAANIEIIDEILTNNKRKAKDSRQPLWYIEAELPHPQKSNHSFTADLVYIGSDNRLRVLEFGNNTSKLEKVRKYAGGIQTLYKRINDSGIPPNRVLPYVVQYAMDDDTHSLTFLKQPVWDQSITC